MKNYLKKDGAQMAKGLSPVWELTLQGYLTPSLNKLFAMNHWQRTREKRLAQLALAKAL